MKQAYDILHAIAEAKPELTKEVVDAIKVGLANDKNYIDSLEQAYNKLFAIAEAKPELAKEVFDAIKVGLANKKNDRISLGIAYNTLSEVAKTDTKLASKVFEEFYREKYGDEVFNALVGRADEILKLPRKKMFFKEIIKA